MLSFRRSRLFPIVVAALIVGSAAWAQRHQRRLWYCANVGNQTRCLPEGGCRFQWNYDHFRNRNLWSECRPTVTTVWCSTFREPTQSGGWTTNRFGGCSSSRSDCESMRRNAEANGATRASACRVAEEPPVYNGAVWNEAQAAAQTYADTHTDAGYVPFDPSKWRLDASRD